MESEIKSKLGIVDSAMPFVITVLGRGNVVVSGVKTVLLSTPSEIKLRVKSGVISVAGDALEILQIGGGEVYVKGECEKVEISQK